MNNHRLLTGLLAAVLCGGVYAQPKVVTLEDIFRSAENGSAQLRPYITATEEAEREISVARAGRLPDIDAQLSFSYIGDGFTVKRNLSDYQKAPIPHLGNGLSISVNQPVYTGGAITAAIDMAELKLTASRYATGMKRQDLRMNLTGFYLDIYKYSNLRQVQQSNIASARKVLEEMRARYDQGVVLRNDITRYELLLSNLELGLVNIDNTLDILNRHIVVTACLPEGTVVIPDSTILARALPTDPESWWQTQASECAPALKLAANGLEISRKAETLTRAERLPKIGLQAGWNIDGPILVEVPPINRNLSYWFVGVGVKYSLSSLFKTDKSLARSRAATRRAAEELDAARENVQLAVNSDYVRYLEAYEVLKTRQKGVELAERNYGTTYTRYASDMALITDMLDAADSRLAAEQELVNARINIIYYYYKLLFTSGKI
ncbi:MAG: TolC family protein [Muribaculaceae bacterium]|nr:TolC family protein [Muribaculaceae bacterium]